MLPLRIMQRSGFHAMSIQSVADEARVSVGLIYQYFGNKEDLSPAWSSTSSRTPTVVVGGPGVCCWAPVSRQVRLCASRVCVLRTAALWPVLTFDPVVSKKGNRCG